MARHLTETLQFALLLLLFVEDQQRPQFKKGMEEDCFCLFDL